MRAPEAAGHDIAVLAQKAAVVLEARPQQLGAFGNLALHFRQQGVADILIERGRIGVARSRTRHGDAAAGGGIQAQRVGGAADLEIDEMKAIGNYEADCPRQLLGDILQPQPDQVRSCKPRIIEVLMATALGPMRYFWSRGR